MAILYDVIGDYENSYKAYMNISEILRKRGFDVEADAAEKSAKEEEAKLNGNK